MGRDTSTKAIIAIDVILAMPIAFLLGCCLNLISVGDQNYIWEVISGGWGRGERYIQSSNKRCSLQLCSHFFLNCKVDKHFVTEDLGYSC